MLFSATMPADISKIAEKFMSSPIRVEVSKQSTTGENITQHKIFIDEKQKQDLLRTILTHENHSSDNTIVFCNSKREVGILSNALLRHGFSVAAIHGDIAQNIRTTVLEQFKAQNLKILVASDVAARGIDVPHVARVINYDIPLHAEDYVHRIGRTGRGGRSGESFSFVDPSDKKDMKRLEAIENLISITINPIDPGSLGLNPPRNTQSKPQKQPSIKTPEEKPENTSEKKLEKISEITSKNTFKTPHRGNEKPYQRSHKKSDHCDVLTLDNDPQSFNDCHEIPAFLLTPLPKFAKGA
jgi:superfamily II DNA/RNA helicase